MARYIDADLAIDEIIKDMCGVPDIDEGLSLAISELRLMPTADVVEVVRCKDCVYYENFLCGRFNAYGDSVEEPEYDYCSYGERREDAEKTD